MSTKPGINILLDLHTAFSNLPIRFRNLVSQECNFSTPTFYRKMRGKDKPDPNNKGKIISALSNAEKIAILRQAEIVYNDIKDFLNTYISR
jgi:hypothetical protein